MGFETMRQNTGLMPQWCEELNVSKVLENASIKAYTMRI